MRKSDGGTTELKAEIPLGCGIFIRRNHGFVK